MGGLSPIFSKSLGGSLSPIFYIDFLNIFLLFFSYVCNVFFIDFRHELHLLGYAFLDDLGAPGESRGFRFGVIRPSWPPFPLLDLLGSVF